jgi:hypothetical protein
MATWKKILTEDDVTNTNLGSSDLTSSSASRTFTLGTGNASFTIENEENDDVFKILNTSTDDVRTELAGGLELVQDYASTPTQGYIKFYEGTSSEQYFSIAGPTDTVVNQYMHFPRSQPSVGQVIRVAANGVTGTNPYVITTEWGDASGTTINNNADNRVITGSGTAGTLEAESNLQYNSSSNILTVNGQAKINDIFVSAQGISSTGDIGIGSRSAIVGSSSTTTAGKVYYYTSLGAWAGASSNVEAHNASLIAIARGSSNSNGMCLEGFIKPDIYNSSNSSTTFALGKAVYLNSNASVTTDVPSASGSFARILGYATSTTVMYFRPSNEYVEIA